jgi:hypothetical protein
VRGETLSSLAPQDIEAKLEEDNIVAETISSFAAQCVLNPSLALHFIPSLNNRCPEIMAIGWKHLVRKLKTERTTSVLGLIKSTKEGNAAHRANSLKFGFYNLLRQKEPAEGTVALLLCCDEKCPTNKDPILRNNLREKIVCPDKYHCSSISGLKCSGCGHVRADHRTWCKLCRRLF